VTRFEPDAGTEELEETEPVTEPAPEPEPEPEAPEEEPDIELAAAGELELELARNARKVSLQKLQAHVAKRLGEILGDEAPAYAACPLCTPFETVGWIPPVELHPEHAAMVYAVLNIRPPLELVDDPHSIECDECAGAGANRMPTRVLEQERAVCVKCQGRGWLAKDNARRVAGASLFNGPTADVTPPLESSSFVPDVAPEQLEEIQRLRDLGYAVVPPFRATA